MRENDATDTGNHTQSARHFPTFFSPLQQAFLADPAFQPEILDIAAKMDDRPTTRILIAVAKTPFVSLFSTLLVFRWKLTRITKNVILAFRESNATV